MREKTGNPARNFLWIQSLLSTALALVLLGACGHDEIGRDVAGTALSDEVPQSSRDQYEMQLEALEERLDRADDDASPEEAARVAALVARHDQLEQRIEVYDDEHPEQDRDRDAFEQDLLQLEADVAGVERELRAATPAGEPAGGATGPGGA
jgi:hypothetical protein